MTREFAGSTVVITGAGSGIGRAAAIEFADRGANVVLAGRREAALRGAAAECEGRGARALAIATDTRDSDAVSELARRATEHFGGFDIWVNNAAVGMYARFEDSPPHLFRELYETNVFGYVHGARTALRQFRETGSGVLINVSSMVADTALPYTSAYTSSKYAIRALSSSLRMELELDRPHEIYVCTVLPASIDTPFFQSSANYTGRKLKAMEPVHDARTVARVIVEVAERPQPEVFAGEMGPLTSAFSHLMPRLARKLVPRAAARGHLADEPYPPNEGNVRRPIEGRASIDGGWRKDNLDASTARRFAAIPVLTGLIGVAGLVGLAAVRRASGSNER